jgi:transcriptional regulator with XRE-family HTH domain
MKQKRNWISIMNTLFADTLKKLRREKGLSQNELADQMFVSKAAVSRWENGNRLPDAAMINRLSKILGVDIRILFSTAIESDEYPNIIMVDDNKDILSDSLSILEEVIPNSMITGFNWPQEAIEYAKTNRIDLAILDIELGTASGFDLCQKLLEINPCTRVIFLTAYPDYALGAWETEACGFLVKPLTPESVRMQLKKLHNPLFMGGADA